MGAGCVLCDDVLRRRIRNCICTFSFIQGWSVDPGTTSQHFGAETKTLHALCQHDPLDALLSHNHMILDLVFP